MNFSPFSCPIFLGHPEARGRCSQGERVLYGRDLCSSGGTGKAEAAKLPGAGIGPKQSYIRECQEKYLPLGSVPRHFSLGIQPNWLGVHPRSVSGLPQASYSFRRGKRRDTFFPPVVPFHGCDSAIRFLKRPSLTVIHLMSGNAWSYLRLVVYGFLGLSEGA